MLIESIGRTASVTCGHRCCGCSGGRDAGLRPPLASAPLQGAVPVVLDRVVGAPGQVLRDRCPGVAELRVRRQQCLVLVRRPVPPVDAGVQVVVPPEGRTPSAWTYGKHIQSMEMRVQRSGLHYGGQLSGHHKYLTAHGTACQCARRTTSRWSSSCLRRAPRPSWNPRGRISWEVTVTLSLLLPCK